MKIVLLFAVIAGVVEITMLLKKGYKKEAMVGIALCIFTLAFGFYVEFFMPENISFLGLLFKFLGINY